MSVPRRRQRMMSTLHRFAALALASLALAGGAAEVPAGPAEAAQHQILVMLRMPAPHFRPDASYGGAYDARIGHESRRRIAAELARDYGLRLMSDWPMPSLGVECYVMEVPVGASARQVSDSIAHDPRAESVQPMNLFRPLAHDDPLYPLQPSANAWHLAELHAWTTGRRVLVAQIDSGVDATHPDLAGQVAATADFVDDGGYVGEAHGTAVAGIIAARADNGVGIAGVAPGARILALRACSQRDPQGAACSSFSLAKAMQFALDRDARVINLSLSGPPDRLLERLIAVAAARGVGVVAAVDPGADDGGFPASDPDVLAVVAEGGPSRTGALAAPGNDVPTTLPPARWGFVSGASFAAAHVTGFVALVEQLAPSIKPRELRALLGLHAHPVADPGAPSLPASRGIDACAIVSRLVAACACACPLADTSTHGPD